MGKFNPKRLKKMRERVSPAMKKRKAKILKKMVKQFNKNPVLNQLITKLQKEPGPPPEGYPYHLRITLVGPAIPGSDTLARAFCGLTLAGISMAYKLQGLSRVMKMALKTLGLEEGPDSVDVKLTYTRPINRGEEGLDLIHYINIFYKEEETALANCYDIARERDEVMEASYKKLQSQPFRLGHKAFYESGGASIPEVLFNGEPISTEKGLEDFKNGL